MTNVTQTPESLFSTINGFIIEQRQVLADGKDVDLTQLEELTNQLCTTMMKLTEENGQRYEDQITVLMDDLCDFSAELVKQRDAIKEDIAELNTQKKAQNAYSTTHSLHKPTTSE